MEIWQNINSRTAPNITGMVKHREMRGYSPPEIWFVNFSDIIIYLYNYNFK